MLQEKQISFHAQEPFREFGRGSVFVLSAITCVWQGSLEGTNLHDPASGLLGDGAWPERKSLRLVSWGLSGVGT